MKKILKWIMIVIISLFAILLVTIKIVSEKKPTVDPSPLAHEKASEMLKAMHIEAWDTLKYLKLISEMDK